MRLRVDASDAGGVATRVDRARAGLPNEVRRSQRQIADGSVVIYRRHAPIKSGKLRAGIRVVGGNTVRADATSERGFDYVPVTRRGRGPVRVKNAKALRMVIGGAVIFRKSAKAWKPASDWAIDARPQVKAKAKSEASGLSRRIGALFS